MEIGESVNVPVGQDAAPASSTQNAWIEIQLVDESGQPVVGEAYRITLPDGSVFPGQTDSEGMGRVVNIESGECQITFPNLDQDAWEKIGDSAPEEAS